MTDARRKVLVLRSVLLGGLMLSAALVASVAVAWACNPQAHLSLDKTTYEAGSTMIAYGSYFPPNVAVMISAPTESRIVQTSPEGRFAAQLSVPTGAGYYTITASRPTGGFAPASFEVIPASPKAPVDQTVPSPAPAMPSPALVSEPDLRGPVILRPLRASEAVRVERNGSVRLYCGRVAEAGVSGTCGAVSTRPKSVARRPFVGLAPKPFRAQAGRPVRLRFYLAPVTLRRVRAARQIRMRGTVLARDHLGNQTAKTFSFILRAPKPANAARRVG